MLARGEKKCQGSPGLPLSRPNLIAQTLDALAIGILGLTIPQLRFIAHTHMPLAESQAYLRLIQGLHTQPLPEATLAPDPPLFPRTLTGILQQPIPIPLHHPI